MFKTRKFYKHQNNTDVCAEVLKVLGIDEGSVSLIVAWWNIVRANKGRPPRKIHPYQVITVRREQVDNWKEFVW